MFKENLQTLARQHLLRELSLINSPSAPVISVEGREVLQFASNDYLGLTNHPQVKDAAMKAIEKFWGRIWSLTVNFRQHYASLRLRS
ncbi:MAG: hypothetical protein MRJ67_01465 [Nitrospirales bacterium]|nr:hypothetical protein [Nitrospirales bacterium]